MAGVNVTEIKHQQHSKQKAIVNMSWSCGGIWALSGSGVWPIDCFMSQKQSSRVETEHTQSIIGYKLWLIVKTKLNDCRNNSTTTTEQQQLNNNTFSQIHSLNCNSVENLLLRS